MGFRVEQEPNRWETGRRPAKVWGGPLAQDTEFLECCTHVGMGMRVQDVLEQGVEAGLS